MLVRFAVGALALCMTSGVAEARQARPDDIVTAFGAVCIAGETGQTEELARADALGWRTTGVGAPKNFDPATQRLSPSMGAALVLTTMSQSSGREVRDSCGVSSLTPVEGVGDAVRNLFGFAPIFVMARSATFSVIRMGTTWQSAAMMDKAMVDAAKHDGRLYSVLVLDNGLRPPDGSDGYAVSLTFLRAKPGN